MYCKNCNREIPDNAKFCSFCGADQEQLRQQEQMMAQQAAQRTDFSNDNNSNLSSTLLLAYIIITVMISVITTIITKNVNNWYGNGWYIFCHLLWIISSLSLILVPLAIKNKTFKIIALVLSVPFILYCFIIHLIEIIKML